MSTPTTDMAHAAGAGYVAYGHSIQGASHLREEKPRQDSLLIVHDPVGDSAALLLAVADGHGDDKHDLSQYGSALAVTAAIAELRELSNHAEGSTANLIQCFRADFPRFLQRRWQAEVLTDARSRGIEVADESDAQFEPSSVRHKLFSRYGTTLLVALVIDDTILLGQLGDGDILIVKPDGTVEAPLPRSDDLTGNVTYSLSSPEAHRLWVTAPVGRADAALLLLATDGLSNSFADDAAFHKFASSLLERVNEYSPQAVAQEMPGWLQGYSERGSGDDITVAFAAFQPDTAQTEEPTNTGGNEQ